MCVFLRFSRLDANEGISIFYQLDSSTCDHQASSTAFLFSLVNKPPDWGPVTLTLRPPGERRFYETAIYSCPSHGPTFGGGNPDIYIFFDTSSNTIKSRSYLGYTYNAPSGYSYNDDFSKSFLAGSFDFQLDEVEVFYETNYK